MTLALYGLLYGAHVWSYILSESGNEAAADGVIEPLRFYLLARYPRRSCDDLRPGCGNLYPIMSQRLVDFSNPESVRSNLKILRLAFTLDIADPIYIPVTREPVDGQANGDPALAR